MLNSNLTELLIYAKTDFLKAIWNNLVTNNIVKNMNKQIALPEAFCFIYSKNIEFLEFSYGLMEHCQYVCKQKCPQEIRI